MKRYLKALVYILGVATLAFFFANVEIQIEGDKGWASGLPTWRIEGHPLLNIFWGGRPMTGYHAWIFSFMALAFHFPLLFAWKWSVKLEARVMGSLFHFWIIEDFVWFLLNPAYGWSKFNPELVPWHKKWILWFPTDYWTFSILGGFLLWWSFQEKKPATK
jgi:hypothetical protein